MAVNLTIKVLISTSLYESPKYLARRNGKFVNAGQLYTASNDPDIPGWYYVTDVGGYDHIYGTVQPAPDRSDDPLDPLSADALVQIGFCWILEDRTGCHGSNMGKMVDKAFQKVWIDFGQ